MTFDGTGPGTPAAVWQADSRLSAAPVLALNSVTAVVIIAPHPDDESLGTGGLIAECAERGIPVRVIMVTDGGASHPSADASERSALVERRRQEAISAAGVLDRRISVEFLGIPDGQILQNRTALTATLTTIFSAMDASSLVIAPWQGDGHRDHRVAGEVSRETARAAGLRLLEYPIWLWHWATPSDPAVPWQGFVRLPLSKRSQAAKASAIALHESQTTVRAGTGAAILHPLFRLNFERSDEMFISSDGDDNAEAASDSAATLGPEYFDATYSRRDDPWGFATRWYEARKRAITLASLPHQRYERGFEIGCSIGMLTMGLAPMVSELLAVDVSQIAVDAARERLLAYPSATISKRDVVADYPAGQFDLIVLSEVGYYLARTDLARLFEQITASLTAEGSLVLCHWRHPVLDYPQSGDEVHASARGLHGLNLIAHHLETDFVLDIYSPDSRSVAQITGLVE